MTNRVDADEPEYGDGWRPTPPEGMFYIGRDQHGRPHYASQVSEPVVVTAAEIFAGRFVTLGFPTDA